MSKIQAAWENYFFPMQKVALTCSDNPNRKTKYDLISVYKESLGWVNIDSQAPNKVVGEWLATKDYTFIKPEYKYGDSRLDFYMEKGEEKYLMEVKGCTPKLLYTLQSRRSLFAAKAVLGLAEIFLIVTLEAAGAPLIGHLQHYTQPYPTAGQAAYLWGCTFAVDCMIFFL